MVQTVNEYECIKKEIPRVYILMCSVLENENVTRTVCMYVIDDPLSTVKYQKESPLLQERERKENESTQSICREKKK